MSVYTAVNETEVAAWLKSFSVGTLVELKGIAAGIENTNYFVTTTHGRYVLTLFERLPREDLPFYLNLMAHLARHGIPCPSPIADHRNQLLGELHGKPAALVTRLPGVVVAEPDATHCAAVGSVLADMHLAGQSYGGRLENPRGPKWWRETAPRVMPFLDAPRQALLREELRFQSLYRLQDLPRGPVHADLFRDNVLFDGGNLGGVIDFYFAGVDTLLFDVAVTVNDWCLRADGSLDPERSTALLRAYHATRPFNALERGAWPVMLRAGALRFWLSRLYDFYLPRPGELVHAHDPEHFHRVLRLRIAESDRLPWVA
ncbi:MAG: homoserine kinase [Burkholderiales bacterium]|jgi:homoserine kinase type II|nr:homoserine kinase [Burkholderiales bacterium]